MSMAPPLPPLTLIVATTPSLGIGLHGSLPWPPLKADLAFFARVTKRPPPPTDSSTGTRTRNAVIMGRKTWDSLPPKVRPLKGRVNVVVSRHPAGLDLPRVGDEDGYGDGQGREQARGQDMVMGVGSIGEGLRKLQTMYAVPAPQQQQESSVSNKEKARAQGQRDEEHIGLGRVFVIGGSEIYRHALEMANCERILWTRLAAEWECDVFFPKDILPTGRKGDPDSHSSTWSTRSDDELDSWAGERSASGLKKEEGVEFEVKMLEKTIS